MATCVRQKMSGSADRRARDSETWEYLFVGDSIPDNSLQAINQAHSTGPDPVPVVGAQLDGRFIFVQNIDAEQTQERRDAFKITVRFGPPEPGENQEQQSQPNPLARPAVYDVQYIESEYVVEQARNVDALTGAFGRAPGTLDAIVNAAYCRPDEPIVDTVRNAVIVIEKNYATLGAIMALNEAFQLTCNSDTCNVGGQSISPRRLKYLCTRSLGRQQEGDIVYYPGVTEIELKKSTDLKLSNVGYDYLVDGGFEIERAKDKKGNDVAEPINLTLNGDKSGEFGFGAMSTITYRHLQEVAYASFFS